MVDEDGLPNTVLLDRVTVDSTPNTTNGQKKDEHTHEQADSADNSTPDQADRAQHAVTDNADESMATKAEHATVHINRFIGQRNGRTSGTKYEWQGGPQ